MELQTAHSSGSHRREGPKPASGTHIGATDRRQMRTFLGREMRFGSSGGAMVVAAGARGGGVGCSVGRRCIVGVLLVSSVGGSQCRD